MNDRSREGHPVEEDREQVYRSLWRSPHWGTAEPNDDERSRLTAITTVLTGCDLGDRPRILDLGCGRGWLSHALARHGDVLGIDVVAASVERARELFPDLTFEQLDTRRLLDSRGPGSFDLVVSSEVIEHVEDADKPAFVSDIYELLRPGGYAIITTPRGELRAAWQRRSDWQQPTEEWVTEPDLDRLAAGVGFAVEQRARAHVYPITPLGRVFASRVFRMLTRILPVLARLTFRWRIYQVVLLRRPGNELAHG
jgi:SAM-dependent methyltransferase